MWIGWGQLYEVQWDPVLGPVHWPQQPHAVLLVWDRVHGDLCSREGSGAVKWELAVKAWGVWVVITHLASWKEIKLCLPPSASKVFLETVKLTAAAAMVWPGIILIQICSVGREKKTFSALREHCTLQWWCVVASAGPESAPKKWLLVQSHRKYRKHHCSLRFPTGR